MPRVAYMQRNFSPGSLSIIRQGNAIIAEYAAQGFDLTLRQLYYQFVARGWIANRDSEYKRLGSIVNDGRLAGLIDWDAIVDRTRNLQSLAHWESPDDLVSAAAEQFRVDRWADQPRYVEVWIEKDALVGVIEPVCEDLDVPYFSCRGYTSQSEMWGAAQRLGKRIAAGKDVHIIHLGDHDPSGLDMTRDIEDRLSTFLAYDAYYRSGGTDDPEEARRLALDALQPFHLERIALNEDQVLEHNPPPNPAKVTDSRAPAYVAEYGTDSWELDALDPALLADLINRSVVALRDEALWAEAERREAEARKALEKAANRWGDVAAFLNGGPHS